MARMNPQILMRAIMMVKDDNEAIEQIVAKDIGRGRGNWGHKGRPGQRGGSAKQDEGAGGESYGQSKRSYPKTDDITARKKSESARSTFKPTVNRFEAAKNLMTGPRLMQPGDQLTLRNGGKEMRITRSDNMEGFFNADIWSNGSHMRSVPITPDDLKDLGKKVLNTNGSGGIEVDYTQNGRETQRLAEGWTEDPDFPRKKSGNNGNVPPFSDPKLAKIRTRLVQNKYGAANGQITKAAEDYVGQLRDKFLNDFTDQYGYCQQAEAVAQKQAEKTMNSINDAWNNDDELGPAWLIHNGTDPMDAGKLWQSMGPNRRQYTIQQATSHPEQAIQVLTNAYDFEYDMMNDIDQSDPDYRQATGIAQRQREEEQQYEQNRRRRGSGEYWNPYEQQWENPD